MANIDFFNEDSDFRLENAERIENWIIKTIESHDKIVGDIAYIFCSDDYLLKVNQDYLNHDYYTDIITFDYSENGIISGDIFISIDRITDNAKQLNQEFNQELLRVLIHGVLHLLGFKDKSPEEEKLMREKEDEAISVYK